MATVTKKSKVKKINKRNYSGTLKRAEQLRQRLKKSLQKGNVPSLHYIQEKWGFNMSDAALVRHRKVVLEELGIEETPKPTMTIPRKKKS